MIVILWLLWIPLSAVMHGFLISTFWNWFITGDGAAFHEQAMHGALPMDISVIQALGISVFISYFLTSALINVINRLDDNDDATESFIKSAVTSVVMFVMFMIIGAIYHAFM